MEVLQSRRTPVGEYVTRVSARSCVPNADYSLDAIVNAELPKDEADRVLGIFAKSIATKQNLLA